MDRAKYEESTTMKTLLLASALALGTAGAAFASVTVYTDGSTYNNANGVTTQAPANYASNANRIVSDVPFFKHLTNDPKVVRFGPPDGGVGGA
jgi:hypothetical protein